TEPGWRASRREVRPGGAAGSATPRRPIRASGGPARRRHAASAALLLAPPLPSPRRVEPPQLSAVPPARLLYSRRDPLVGAPGRGARRPAGGGRRPGPGAGRLRARGRRGRYLPRRLLGGGRGPARDGPVRPPVCLAA